MEHNKIIERFAEVQGISYEDAEKQLGEGTDEELLKRIEQITTEQIKEKNPIILNRKQRRALKKKLGKKKYAELEMNNEKGITEAVADTTKKLNYIDLIQKLRAINEKNEKEKENEKTEENDL